MFAKMAMFFIIIGGLSGTANFEPKGFSLSHICDYSGPSREYLIGAFTDELVTKSQSQLPQLLGEEWELRKTGTPKSLFTPDGKVEKNVANLSFRAAERRCAYNENTNIFRLFMQLKEGGRRRSRP